MRNFLAPILLLIVLVSSTIAADMIDESPTALKLPGLHNVYRIGERLYSGSGPESDEAFAALAQLGVKTVLSVDGTATDVERAKQHGLRYVHVPIGYNGVPRDAALQIARAVRELPGPFYVHCHHGKHRGPAAAAIARLCLDEQCQVDQALNIMQRAGTDPRYAGLFRSVRDFKRPSEVELKQLAGPLPATVKATGVKQQMVVIDQAWSHLKMLQTAGWKTLNEQPDLTPAHEALQLVEGFKELSRLPDSASRGDDYREWIAESLRSAEQLEAGLRHERDNTRRDDALRAISERCAKCHAKYRD